MWNLCLNSKRKQADWFLGLVMSTGVGVAVAIPWCIVPDSLTFAVCCVCLFSISSLPVQRLCPCFVSVLASSITSVCILVCFPASQFICPVSWFLSVGPSLRIAYTSPSVSVRLLSTSVSLCQPLSINVHVCVHVRLHLTTYLSVSWSPSSLTSLDRLQATFGRHLAISQSDTVRPSCDSGAYPGRTLCPWPTQSAVIISALCSVFLSGAIVFVAVKRSLGVIATLT